MIVIDASALVSLVASGDRRSAAIARRTEDEALVAPEVIDLEFIHALRGLVLGGKLSRDRAEIALRAYDSVPIERYPHRGFLPRIWELRNNVTAYDAAYIALAELLDASLVTGDSRLASASGVRCVVELIS